MTMPSGSSSSGYNLTNWDGVLLAPTTGISGLVNTTQANVTAQKKAQFQGTDVISQVFGALFAGLPAGMSLPLAILTMLARAILGAPDAIWGSVEAVVHDVPVLGVVADTLQGLIDAMVTALTGTTSTGNAPSAIPLAIIGAAAAIPAQILDTLFGLISQVGASVTALQNNPTGASQTDDFLTVALSAWTSIL